MASDALISLVVDQLVSYAQQQVTQVTGAREEVGKLTITLKIIQGVLADAEEKQVQKNAVKVWLAELKDVLYAADDVLDEWHTKTVISKLQTCDVDVNMASASTRKKVLSFLFPICHCLKDVTMRYDIGGQIKDLRVRLDVIAKEREQYGLDVIEKEREQYALVASSSHSEPPSITTLTSSIIDDVSGIRGRVGDKQTILDMLLSDTSCQGRAPIHVISIVGTGGFGKTTLARLVYNDTKVKMTFEKKMWVCVSQPFDFLKIAKDIIEQATGHVPDFHGLEALHQHLSDSVKEKKFLLILDDVWTENPEHWTPLNSSLSGGSSGSRIIVTTRNKEVAMMMGSTHIYDLKVLSGEDSWSLLSHVALKEREHDLHKFEKIGREIACKCKGVPLAIQIVARFLCHKRLIQEWRDVANNNLWEMSKIKEFFLPSLLISYNSLSPISKQCFLFCAVFPKDTEMLKSELVLLWMANGFFGYEGNNELEKRGEHHFDILAMRSFFQDFRRYSDGVIGCKMHDLVHDFAQFLSQDECFIDDGNGGEFNASKVRHLWTENFDDKLYMAKNLRTVMVLRRNIFPHIGKLVCLRTLDLSRCDIEELPSGVCRLLHLRYLDLSYNSDLFELPEEVCNLYNLQTLKLKYCVKLRKLPERIGDLSNLRHLDLEDTIDLTYLPRGITRLILLRTLSKFIVGELNTTECKIGDLKHLTKLQGELLIEGLERMKDGNEAAEAELNKMNAINSLTLCFGRGDDDPVGINTTANSVLEKLEPPEYLEKLAIYTYPGDRFPGWMHDSLLLSNIVEIVLYAFDNCTQLPPLGNLGSLETLQIIYGFRRVKRVGPEFFGGVSFPKLRSLTVSSMDELEELNMIPLFLQEEEEEASTTTIIIMPNLRELTINNCPKLTNLKVVTPYYMFSPTLERMQIYHCPLLEKLFSGGDEGVSSSDPLPLNNPQLAQPPPYSSLRTLNIMFCESLDFDLKDLQQFSNLQHMNIFECPHLEKRFQGEEWRSIRSHVLRITFTYPFYLHQD